MLQLNHHPLVRDHAILSKSRKPQMVYVVLVLTPSHTDPLPGQTELSATDFAAVWQVMTDFTKHGQQKLLMYGDFGRSLWTSGVCGHFNFFDIRQLSAKGSTPIDALADRVVSLTTQRKEPREHLILLYVVIDRILIFNSLPPAYALCASRNAASARCGLA